MSKKERKSNPKKFVVAYRGQHACVYGLGGGDYPLRMTINQAEQLKRSLAKGAVIYKLVEVEEQ